MTALLTMLAAAMAPAHLSLTGGEIDTMIRIRWSLSAPEVHAALEVYRKARRHKVGRARYSPKLPRDADSCVLTRRACVIARVAAVHSCTGCSSRSRCSVLRSVVICGAWGGALVASSVLQPRFAGRQLH